MDSVLFHCAVVFTVFFTGEVLILSENFVCWTLVFFLVVALSKSTGLLFENFSSVGNVRIVKGEIR